MPTYMTPEDAAWEEKIAAAFAARYGVKQMKVGRDPPPDPPPNGNEYGPAVDRVFYDMSRVVGFGEVKRHKEYSFGECPKFVVSEAKILCCRKVAEILCVPVLLIVAFRCGTFAYLRTSGPYTKWKDWGRTDRNDPRDIETGACFTWDRLCKWQPQVLDKQ